MPGRMPSSGRRSSSTSTDTTSTATVSGSTLPASAWKTVSSPPHEQAERRRVITPRRRRLGIRVAEIQRRTGVPYDSVLRDHALSYVLAGIAAVPELLEHAVFKGGTALRKCFFPGYRYSEDLDFSSRDHHVWTPSTMLALLADACRTAQRLAESVDAPYTFTPRLQQHRDDRSDVQHNLRISVEYPTGATLPIKFELTQVEPIVRPIEPRRVVHEFADEPLDITIPVYALDQVALEKLRALLQTAANLGRRSWTNRARDLYDLWWLWTEAAPVAWDELRDPLATKAAAREVAFSGPDDFLDRRVLDSYRNSWSARLANVVPLLPPFDEALTALRSVLDVVFRHSTACRRTRSASARPARVLPGLVIGRPPRRSHPTTPRAGGCGHVQASGCSALVQGLA